MIDSHIMGGIPIFAFCLVLASDKDFFSILSYRVHKGSYMGSHVLFNLLNKLGKGIKCEACNTFDKFNSTRVRVLDSIYHMALRLL